MFLIVWYLRALSRSWWRPLKLDWVSVSVYALIFFLPVYLSPRGQESLMFYCPETECEFADGAKPWGCAGWAPQALPQPHHFWSSPALSCDKLSVYDSEQLVYVCVMFMCGLNAHIHRRLCVTTVRRCFVLREFVINTVCCFEVGLPCFSYTFVHFESTSGSPVDRVLWVCWSIKCLFIMQDLTREKKKGSSDSVVNCTWTWCSAHSSM